MTTDDPQPQTRRCQRCGLMFPIAAMCAIARTFVMFFYCTDCYEIEADKGS